MNRLSFYEFDKHTIMNLCKIIHEKNMNISGVYQKNDTSFWFPDFIVYKMDIHVKIMNIMNILNLHKNKFLYLCKYVKKVYYKNKFSNS